MPNETELETSSYEAPATPESPSWGATPLSQAPDQYPFCKNNSNFSQELQKQTGSFQSKTASLDSDKSLDERKVCDTPAAREDSDNGLGTQSLQETPESFCHDADVCDEDQDGGLTDDQLAVEQPITQIFHPEIHCETRNEIHCAQDDIADDNDSESDVSSSSSEASPMVLEGLSEVRERKVARNQTMMKQLGLIQGVKPKNTKRKPRRERVMEKEDGVEEGCMLWSGTKLSGSGSQDVYLKYPGREPQIRLVKSIVHATIAQLDGEETFVPPPLFITGPGGTCKTSIIRDIVQSVCSPRIASAYVNCATLEPSSIETLVESAYQQIARTFLKDKKDNKVHETETSQLSSTGFPVESEFIESIGGDLEERVEQARSLLCPLDDDGEVVQKSGNGSPAGAPREHGLSSDWKLEGNRNTGDHVRLSGTRRLDDLKEGVSRGGQILNARTRYSRHSKPTDPGSRPIQKQNYRSTCGRDDARQSATASIHGAPLAFARSLMPFIGEHGAGSAFLILDCAERLMKLHPNRTSATTKTNFLAQLLLLPKVMQLNLSIIVISRSTLLMHSRKSTSLESSFHAPSIHTLLQRY
jgi:hypothetical protein